MKIPIFTLTPNPALDLGGMVTKIVPNEKVYVHQPTLYPGGNGINAARIAHRLGSWVEATGFVAGGTGQEIERFLTQEGVLHSFIPVEGMTRISVTVTTEGTPMQTRLSFPGPRIPRTEAARLQRKIAAIRRPALLVIGGSLPQGFTPAQVSALVRQAHRNGILPLVDMPGPILRQVLPSRPFFIKPNLTEFQELIGRKVSTLSAVLTEARKLNRLVPLICISSVEDGALLVSKKCAWFGKLPPVKVHSTVGAGDSMVGAMSHRLSHLPDFMARACAPSSKLAADVPELLDDAMLSDLLRWGLAASWATLIHTGTTLGRAQEIRRFRSRVVLRKC